MVEFNGSDGREPFVPSECVDYGDAGAVTQGGANPGAVQDGGTYTS